MIAGIHSFSIIVSSELSVSFYEKIGFSVVSVKERKYDTVAIMEGYGIQLQLFIDPRHPKRASDPENLGLRQVAFEVQSIEDLETRFICSEVRTDWFGNKYCHVFDPDGQPIQFVERKSV